jgi:hypothetical protein
MDLPVKIFIVGNIKKGNSVLWRKKFAGSTPYSETWYSFGCEFVPGADPAQTFIDYIRGYLNIEISVSRHLSWDTEMKNDPDGEPKQFIHLELGCDYVSGEPVVPEGLEKVEFVAVEDLPKIDIVPPSLKMFRRLGIF